MICPDDIGKVTSEHIRAFLLGQGERTSPAFAQQHHRNIHVCFRWIETEGSGWNPNPMVRDGETLGSRGGVTLLHRSRDYSPAAGLHRAGLRVPPCCGDHPHPCQHRVRVERQRLAGTQAAIDAIRSHLQRGGLSDGLVFDAVRIRLLEIGEGAPSIGAASAYPSLLAADSR